MKTFTKILAATALLASTSTAALAQGNSGGALDAAGSVSVDAGSTSVDAGASGNANANSNAVGNGAVNANSNASGAANANAGSNANSNAGGNGNGASNAAASGNAGGNASANVSANSDAELNYGQIISDLRSSATTVDDIEALDETSLEVEVVTLAELRGNAGENAAALEQAFSAETVTEQLDALEAKLTEAGRTLAAVLDTYTEDQVVAVTTSAEGEVILVVDESK